MEFKLGELFCGPGGLALGAKSARARKKKENCYILHKWANDYDKDSCETYGKNICPNDSSSVIRKDIRKLNYSKLGKIDALAFGFPCNDFSVVGKKKGINGAYGPLYSYCVKALYNFKPKWFLAENVGGLKTSNDGSTFNIILNELFKAGYSVYPHLYKFEEYGVPQNRHRIIIIGIRNDFDLKYRIPTPNNSLRISSRQALENPPIKKEAPNNELTKQSPHVIERLKHIKPGENVFTANLPEHLKLNMPCSS